MRKDGKQKSVLISENNHTRKKLLMGVTQSEVGGSQKVVYDLIKNLSENEFDITLVTSPGGELIDWINDLNDIRIHKVKITTLTSLKREISPVYDLIAFLKLFKIINKGKYDIVHFHGSKIGTIGRIAAWIAKVPKIFYTAHGWGIKVVKSKLKFEILSLFEKLAGRLSTMVICVSENDMHECIKNKWAKKEKVCVIHNGISEIPEMKSILHKELDFPCDMPVIASVIRLSEPKDPIFTIKVAGELIRSGYEITLLLIGDGPLRKDCEAVINDLGIGKYVQMTGMYPHVRSLLPKVDIALLLSKWEGLPIYVLEAMVAGKPIIASNVGGISELIRHGDNGYLLDRYDIGNAVFYLKKLLDDKNLRETMGHAGKEKALIEFTMDEMIKKHKKLYLKTL